jgi:hypothetical protein
MQKASRFIFRSGCLVSVLAPVIGVVVYPKAKGLFGFVLVGIALVVFHIFTAKDPTPQEVADRADRLLSGSFGQWDVDNYEHLNPKDPQVRQLWQRTMAVGGLPEEWTRLNEETRNQIRGIIQNLRQLRMSISA